MTARWGTSLFVAAVGLDTASFLVLTAFAPVPAFELNPAVLILVATFGIAVVAAIKVGLGLAVALTFDRLRPALRFRLLLGACTILTLVGAGTNIAAIAGGLG